MRDTTQRSDLIHYCQLSGIICMTRSDIIRNSTEKKQKSIGSKKKSIFLLFEALICPYPDYFVYMWFLHLRKVSGVRESTKRSN